MKSLRGCRRKAPGERKTSPEREVPESLARLRGRRTDARSAARRLAAGCLMLAGVALAIALLAGKGAASRRQRARPAVRGQAAAHEHARLAAASGQPNGTASESQETPRLRRLAALGKPIYCAGPRGDEVALTFDDGPGQYTRLALAKLRKHHVKATFFVVGRNIALTPHALRLERRLGAVGDHTYTHPLLTSLSPGQAEAEIVRTKHAVEAASGAPVFLFRPPYGARDETIDSIAKANGLLEIMWTVDSADSLGASYAQIERNVIAGLRPGAIVLMHENRGQTIRAMLGIFAALHHRRLRPVSVAKLLADDPPSEAQLRAGGAGCGVRSPVKGSGG